MYKTFKDPTGIQVNVVKASADQLIERSKGEGARSPADLLMIVDAAEQQVALKMRVFFL